MKSKLHLLYKILWMCFKKKKNTVCTILFKALLFVNNVEYGCKLRTYGAIPQLRINKKVKNVFFGKNVVFNNYDSVAWFSKCSIWVKEGASLVIGDCSGLSGSLIFASKSITIGKNVKIGGGTKIFDTDFHPLNYEVRRASNEGTLSAPIIIDDDVFIGTSCLILKGVHIGTRSIVAAGSVVTKSIPADEIWGGNPAKYIRKII